MVISKTKPIRVQKSQLVVSGYPVVADKGSKTHSKKFSKVESNNWIANRGADRSSVLTRTIVNMAQPPAVKSSTVKELVKKLSNSSYKVRITAAIMLGKLRSSQDSDIKQDYTSGAVLVAIINRLHSEKNVTVREMLLRTLGMIGDRRAVDALARILYHPYWPEPNPKIRAAAAWALGKLGGPKAVKALFAAWKKDKSPSVRKVIVKAILPSMISQLIGFQKTRSRVEVANMLGKIKNPAAVNGLSRMLSNPLWKSKSVALRVAAAKALGEIGNRKALNALKAALKDKSAAVRAAAKAAIQKIVPSSTPAESR